MGYEFIDKEKTHLVKELLEFRKVLNEDGLDVIWIDEMIERVNKTITPNTKTKVVNYDFEEVKQ